MPRNKAAGYPEWICDSCGQDHGTWYKKGVYTGPPHHYPTYHMGTCQICGQTDVAVTQPRDYGHLHSKWMEIAIKSKPIKEENIKE